MGAHSIPVNRQWVVILKDGTYAIDWGDGMFLDLYSGEFLRVDKSDLGYQVKDEDLDWLMKTGRVASYDDNTVKCNNLPERPLRTIE